MFSLGRQRQAPSVDEEAPDDNSYARELHGPLDSLPFDEQSIGRLVAARTDSEAPPGTSWEYPKDETEQDDGDQDDDRAPGFTESMEDFVRMSDDSESARGSTGDKSEGLRSLEERLARTKNLADAVASIGGSSLGTGSGDGGALGSKDGTSGTRSLEEMSCFSYKSATDTDRSGSFPNDGSFDGTNKSAGGNYGSPARSVRSDGIGRGSPARSVRSSQQTMIESNSPARSARSGRSTILSGSQQTTLTDQQARTAYDEICCRGRFVQADSPARSRASSASVGSPARPEGSPARSVASMPDKGRARADTLTTASRMATPTFESVAGAAARPQSRGATPTSTVHATTPDTPTSLTSRETQQTRETQHTSRTRESVAAAIARGVSKADDDDAASQRTPIPPRGAALSFGAESAYSAAGTETGAVPPREEGEDGAKKAVGKARTADEGAAEGEFKSVWEEPSVFEEGGEDNRVLEGLRRLQKKTELRDKMIQEETKKEEAPEIVKSLDGKRELRVRIESSKNQVINEAEEVDGGVQKEEARAEWGEKAGKEAGGDGDDVMLAKLMTRSGTLDRVPTPGEGERQARDALGEIREEAEPKEEAPSKDDKSVEKGESPSDAEEEAATKEMAPPARADEVRAKGRDSPAARSDEVTAKPAAKGPNKKSLDSSHSSRGKFAFRKLKSKNLKSKRFFGGKKKGKKDGIEAASEEDSPVWVKVAEIPIADDGEEVEMTYGPGVGVGGEGSDESKEEPDDPGDEGAVAEAAPRALESDEAGSSVAKGTKDDTHESSLPSDIPTKGVLDGATKVAGIPRVESSRTESTGKVTVESKENNEGELEVVMKSEEGEGLPVEEADDGASVGAGEAAAPYDPTGIFARLFACGAGALRCTDPDDVADACLIDGDSVEDVELLRDDEVDESLNVEVYQDANRVTRIGTFTSNMSEILKERDRKDREFAAHEASCADEGRDAANVDASKITTKDVYKTHVRPNRMEVVPSEDGIRGDVVVDPVSAKVEHIAQKLERRRERSSRGPRGKRTGLRMKLMKRLSKKDRPSTTNMAVAESTDSAAATRGRGEKVRRRKKGKGKKKVIEEPATEEPQSADAIMAELEQMGSAQEAGGSGDANDGVGNAGGSSQ